MIDQASKLRDMLGGKKPVNNIHKKSSPIKIYSVVSGKGGVGKTNFSVNLGIKLQQEGKKVLVLDADIGMSNANIILGINSKLNLSHLLNGEATMEEIISKGPEGLSLISGGSDLFLMEALNDEKQQEIMESLSGLETFDVIIIDNGAGITKHSLTFSTFAHEIILITTPEPTALTDAYRVLKVNCMYNLKDRVKLVVNQIQNKSQGEEAYNKLRTTSETFLNIDVENLGFIFRDARMNKAIMEQVPIVLKYPNSLASINISQISMNILNDKNFKQDVSGFKEFSNRLIRFFG